MRVTLRLPLRFVQVYSLKISIQYFTIMNRDKTKTVRYFCFLFRSSFLLVVILAYKFQTKVYERPYDKK